MRDDGSAIDVAEERDLVAHVVGNRASRPGRQITSGWIPIGAQLRTLCWVGLVLSSPVAPSTGQQRDVDVEDVLTTELAAHLADRFEERLALDVADRAADFGR